MKKILSPIGVVSCCLVFSAVHSQVKAQTRTVTGQVNNGKSPINGATITQEGTTEMTTTSSNGTFTLQLTGEKPVLVLRHPEYTEQKINTNGKITFSISLNEKVKSIEEVVLNAGYYNVKAKESTGSIARVTARDIANQPVNNVLAAVQGRMAGVNITQNSGSPGGGYQIQIRGRNSLRTMSNSGIDGSQPLYVIDGNVLGSEIESKYSGTALAFSSISPLNSINPNDIETLEILKDADATAIYGSRGANGVILITTKRAKAGQLNITFNSNYGLSTTITNLTMMNTEQYLGVRRRAYINDNITSYPANAYDINNKWDTSRYTDWVKRLLGKTATSSEVRTSISGGNEQTSFRVAIGHTEYTTPFGDDFKYLTNTLSTNLSHRSKDKKLSFNLTNTFAWLKNNLVNSDITRQAYILSPNAPALYIDGTLNWENNTFSNPVAAYNSRYNYDNKQFSTNINTSYELFPGIILKMNGGVNYQFFEEWSFQPNTMYNPSSTLGKSSATSKALKYTQNRSSIQIEPQINWQFSKGHHNINTIIGSTLQHEDNNKASMSGTGFASNELIRNIAAAQTHVLGEQLYFQYKYAAVFGRLNYNYKGKYILNLTGRRDGSSRFGPGNKFANFGAAGAAWLFSEENFLKNASWLSYGKLRGSYGTTGSDNIGDYQFLDTFTVSNLIYNGTTGLNPSRLYNPDYSWEKTRKFEAALELGLFENHLNFTVAWYKNKSSNQLVGYQLPTITGFNAVVANLPAVVQNTGLEAEVTVKPFTNRTFKWETSANISFPKNKLVSFPGLEGSTYSNSYVVGMPLNIIKLYNLEGIDPNTGKYIFTDYNGDGKISAPNDNKIIENIGVTFFGGWSNSLSFKNWNFGFLLQFVQQKSRNYNYIMPVPGTMSNLPVEALDVWSPSNPTGFYMPYHSTTNTLHSTFQASTASVSDASFIRVKNIQLGYSIPTGDTIFKNAKLYFQGQNLMTFSKYFGLDPESAAMSFLPQMKTYSFGFQCNF